MFDVNELWLSFIHHDFVISARALVNKGSCRSMEWVVCPSEWIVPVDTWPLITDGGLHCAYADYYQARHQSQSSSSRNRATDPRQVHPQCTGPVQDPFSQAPLPTQTAPPVSQQSCNLLRIRRYVYRSLEFQG